MDLPHVALFLALKYDDRENRASSLTHYISAFI